ncbi:MAG: hypothetical protein R3C70_18765 [Geminicoccaceae bacterium]
MMDIESWIALGQVLAGFGTFAASVVFAVVLVLAYKEIRRALRDR